MTADLSSDLLKLKTLAYHRESWSGDLVRKAHALRAQISAFQDGAAVEGVYRWLFVPITLWPLNMHDLLAQCLDGVEAGRRVSKQLRLLVEFVGEPPGESVCKAVAAHEWKVAKGRYEDLVKASAKFDSIEEELAESAELQADWKRITELFDVESHADRKGVIRRTMVAERGFRPGFGLRWGSPAARFQAVFDAFCQRWNLYGMENGRPLVLKLSVNLTPHGTMIFIPSYWSLDPTRDVAWREVTALHKTRVPKRQGAALAASRRQRKRDAAKARRLTDEAKQRGLHGDKGREHIFAGLKWDKNTDPSRLRRLLKEFPA